MNVNANQSTPPGAARAERSTWEIVRLLWPQIWRYRARVAIAFVLMASAKVVLISVSLVLAQLVDALNLEPRPALLPLSFLLAYGALRLSSTMLQELRQVVFARVMARTSRVVARRVFEHLHALSLRFHLDRRTGAVSRDLERGMGAISDLLDWTIYTILPTVLEIVLVTAILAIKFDWTFPAITIGTLIAYVAFTFRITEWRLRYYRAANEADTHAAARAVDSLLNYETVKYFNNEAYESKRYDEGLVQLEEATVKSLKSLAVLNIGQSAVVAIGLTLLLWRGAIGVLELRISVGELVMINAFLLQLAAPLNFLGMVYREVKQALTNIERMFALLDEPQEVRDLEQAPALPPGGGSLRFENVEFGYDARRQILHGVDFEVPAGGTVAVVGATGSGKSTLARLLYRFFDVNGGRITIDGHDLREIAQDSLRQAIGIVPQDTVLFNDSIYYNIAYGRPAATRDEVIAAARAAHIHDFIHALPDGYQAQVGERGLKLSGGEKQRVAIARTILKNPRILILDEATSALDTRTERAIQAELEEVSRERTTLVIAHRLSTIVDADQILVMDAGRIVERGTHAQLLAHGERYAQMWQMQQESSEFEAVSVVQGVTPPTA